MLLTISRLVIAVAIGLENGAAVFAVGRGQLLGAVVAELPSGDARALIDRPRVDAPILPIGVIELRNDGGCSAGGEILDLLQQEVAGGSVVVV